MTLPCSSSPLTVAEVLTDRLPKDLATSAQILFKVLVATAVETIKGKGYSTATSHMVFHLPVEQLGRACGFSRFTVWRHLPALRELGVIDYRTHKASCRGKTYNSGTVFMVRLNPSSGSKCRLSFHDLKFKWRDLDADVRLGRTSYKLLKHTKPNNSKQIDISVTTVWTLAIKQSLPPLSSVCSKHRQVALEDVLSLKTTKKADVPKAVSLAAQALSQALRDQGSKSFYQKLLWCLLKKADVLSVDAFYQVYLAAKRCQVDDTEKFARSPGALFTSRLKKFSWYDSVMTT